MNEEKKFDKTKIITNALTIAIAIVISVVFLGALYVVAKPMLTDKLVANNKEADKYMESIKEALNKVSSTYIEDVSMDKLVQGAISGITDATDDPYTRYMTQEEYDKSLVSGTETYGGIGVHLTYDKDEDSIVVIGLMPNSPAQEMGLKAGDLIIQVADTIVSKDTYYDCVDKIKGEENSKINIKIKRGNEIIDKSLTRKVIKTNNIESSIVDSNIGYIKIYSFDNDIYKQFKEAYENLKSKNITGLIIDVRNNPGGLVSDTIKIAEELLPKADLLKLVYKNGSQKVYKCDGRNEIKIPLAIVTNTRSASASEILAGCIKDSGKGEVIGTKTFGKGIVQNIQPLENNMGALSVTSSKYYTASGIEIHKNGIEPNILVELPEEVNSDMIIPFDKDLQLKKAIEYINSKK